MLFQLVSKFKPTGDQPQTIKKLTTNIKAGVPHNVLLGVTGSGKTFSIANVIKNLQLPTLWICHNKTLAAQTYQELKEFFPNNAVHYFVSYYDYYQPEAYLPQTDTYIEKDAKINEEIDRLRHFAVQDLLQRKDTIVVASVSCIYNLGSPQNYQKIAWNIQKNQKITRKDFLSTLVDLQYQRNDIDFKPGTFRVRGDVVEINIITGEKILQVEFANNRIDALSFSATSLATNYKPLTTNYSIFPANFWTTPESKLKIAIENIKMELHQRLGELKKQAKLLEMQRLEQRTNYDIEMMLSTGVCNGIENYSSHLEFREKGTPPFTLLDYFACKEPGSLQDARNQVPYKFLTVIDESHMSIPQLNAMYNTDKARKKVLIEHGFRLPSALDNRPLSFDEFAKKAQTVIYSSATPGKYELAVAKNKDLAQQLIRPTGLLEPSIEIKPLTNQAQDLIKEIEKRIKKKQRTLAITLTKRMAEELADFLQNKGIKAVYLHSEIKTMERPKILQDFREGKFDCIVGINLLREGLDLPEVALIGILDADKEGFLRNETTLIQTMGRAARHLEGHCILYADKHTMSIKNAIREIERRRKIQIAYNKKHRLVPKAIVKPIQEWGFNKEKPILAEFGDVNDIILLEKEMKIAAKNLNFERAAEIQDLIKKIKK